MTWTLAPRNAVSYHSSSVKEPRKQCTIFDSGVLHQILQRASTHVVDALIATSTSSIQHVCAAYSKITERFRITSLGNIIVDFYSNVILGARALDEGSCWFERSEVSVRGPVSSERLQAPAEICQDLSYAT